MSKAPSRLPAALDLLARVRTAMTESEVGDLHDLLPLVDRLRLAIEQDPPAGGAERGELLALLDEVASLSHMLGAAREQARDALRGAGARARAGAAYHRAGRL
jgi:hypothetical protein